MSEERRPGDFVIDRMFETGRVIAVKPGRREGVIDVWCDYYDEVVILEAQVRPPTPREPSISKSKRSFTV